MEKRLWILFGKRERIILCERGRQRVTNGLSLSLQNQRPGTEVATHGKKYVFSFSFWKRDKLGGRRKIEWGSQELGRRRKNQERKGEKGREREKLCESIRGSGTKQLHWLSCFQLPFSVPRNTSCPILIIITKLSAPGKKMCVWWFKRFLLVSIGTDQKLTWLKNWLKRSCKKCRLWKVKSWERERRNDGVNKSIVTSQVDQYLSTPKNLINGFSYNKTLMIKQIETFDPFFKFNLMVFFLNIFINFSKKI